MQVQVNPRQNTVQQERNPMADILKFRKPSLKDKHKGNTLCRRGHHKWVVDTASQFDVKRGRLVTVFRCSRCDERKVKAL